MEAARANRQAEVGAARTMIERIRDRFVLKPKRLAADTAYGTAKMLGWLVKRKSIVPHKGIAIPKVDSRCDKIMPPYAKS